MDAQHIVLSPRISESSYAQAQDGVYTFDVSMDINKHDIKEAIEKQYDVSVTKVTTLVNKGKLKTSNNRRGRSANGKRNDRKKAYVTLKKGDTIKLFEENQ